MHHHRDYQAINSACLIDPTQGTHRIFDPKVFKTEKLKTKTSEQQRGTCAEPGKRAAPQRLPPSVPHRYDCRKMMTVGTPDIVDLARDGVFTSGDDLTTSGTIQSRGSPTRQHSTHSFEPCPGIVFGQANSIQVDSDGHF